MPGQTPHRVPSELDRLADSYFDRFLALNPLAATYLGAVGYDARLPDLSPSGLDEMSVLRRETLRSLQGMHCVDSIDQVTHSSLEETLFAAEALRDADREESLLRNIASPLQELREIFDLMPLESVADWVNMSERLHAVSGFLAGYASSLSSAAARGSVSPRRQVEAVIEQSFLNASPRGVFGKLDGDRRAQLPSALVADVQRGIALASAAFMEFGLFLRDVLLPQAPTADPVGSDLYLLHSRQLLGTTIEPADTYEWGLAELDEIEAEMDHLSRRFVGLSGRRAAFVELDGDPSRRVKGRDEIVRWMQAKADHAISGLDGVHFDIPEPLRVIECGISPGGTGAITYTPASEDLRRPGRMWWDLAEGVDELATWRELTTVYHEGAPGHHLQASRALWQGERLNHWRKIGCWFSGHGEGWALYAEQLMRELGFYDDPADLLGMLDAQAMRAARLVLDIGMHCGLPAPAEVGGGTWNWEKGQGFLAEHCAADAHRRDFELTRYLGWPGQGAAYKVGQRAWTDLRREVAAREGAAFRLQDFHTRALDIGSTGLDVLRNAVLVAG
ncbi:hypothetical protein ASD13_05560 [Microbacterium sp. Root1433D1]|uniref:DUF885 domain-containing protein n=1 Tax=Microbacterium sp. Root1433D1 TaxID=1736463 RepID=UPI0006F2EB82|nr:DUF885 domain-containing protein [Microbacterium sp. Root1433D1]KQY78119.1 hypothetical protein ASD13_05560 [Microbacterium sp. Root1433D1]